MRHKVKLPRLADSTDDYVVVSWEVDVGAAVTQGSALVVVETDKTTTELPAPISGTLVEVLVAVDDDVHTGDAICVIEA